jgi:hypothetical protein
MVVPFSALDKTTTEEEKTSSLLEGEEKDDQCSSSTTSSIGKDSDTSECGDIDNEENEAQSAYKYDEPLNMMNALQQLLPIRYCPFSHHTSLVCVLMSPNKNDFVILFIEDCFRI